MKKILALAFILHALTAFSKCAVALKSGNEISVVIDGINTTFNTISVAKQTADYGTYTLTITAVVNNYSEEEISLSLTGLFPVKEGSFVKGLTSYGSHTPDISYNHQGLTYKTAEYPVSPVTIVISSINGTNVQGSFSGRLYVRGPGHAESVELTNGKFDVDLK